MFRQIAEHYGLNNQLDMLTEELAELIQAVSKYKRSMGIGSVTPVTINEAHDNLIEEIADVELLITQIKYLDNISDLTIKQIQDEKIQRTLRRL